MLLGSVFGKSVWDARRGLVGWLAGMALVTVMYGSLYPQYSKPSMLEAVKAMPQGLLKAFNMGDFASPAGYLESTVLGIMGPLLMIIFAITGGTRAIAGDQEAGTLELLLAHPVGRTQVVLQRFAALVATTVMLGLAMFAVLLMLRGPAKLSSIPVGNMAAATLQLVLLALCLGTLALALGGLVGRRAFVLAVTVAVAVVTYFANTILPQVHGLEWARRYSPFYYYAHGAPLRHGVQWGDVTVLTVVILIFMSVAVVSFGRRDAIR